VSIENNDNMNGGGGSENTHYPDDLQPHHFQDSDAAMAGKFALRAGPTLLDTLDDPSSLIQGALDRGVDLSVAEVILAEILSTLRERTHHKDGANIVVPINPAASGYFKVAAALSGNQYIRVVTFFLAIHGAGTLTFVHGTNGSAADAPLSGVIDLAFGVPFYMHAPNPRNNPLFHTSPGAILGLVTTSNQCNGFMVIQHSADQF
jgi:hypothetical protein